MHDSGNVLSPRICGLVNTLNEAHNIRYALGSLLPWCDEVIVIDQDSDDETAEISRSMGARVVSYPRTGFVEAARAFGVEQVEADWLLILDADEMIRPALGRYLRDAVKGEPDADVFLLPRANVIFGRQMRHGTNWPSRRARFFRPDAIEISSRIHHGLEPRPGSRLRQVPARPELAIWHFSYQDAATLVDKVNRYTSVEARQGAERGERPPRARRFLQSGARWFWRSYLRDGGYRDGTAGLILAVSRAYYRFLRAAKAWELPRMEASMSRVARMRDELLAEHPPLPMGPRLGGSADPPIVQVGQGDLPVELDG